MAAWAAAAPGPPCSWPGVPSAQASLPGPMGQVLPRPLEMLIRAWAGPTSSPIHPQSHYKGPQQPETGCGLTPKDSLAPRGIDSPWGYCNSNFSVPLKT